MNGRTRYDHRTGQAGRNGPHLAGFTLIELLTVVMIIGLLVGMVVPTIQSVLEALQQTRTLARIDSLAGGAKMYKMEGTGNKYFPGQLYAKAVLDGTTSIGAPTTDTTRAKPASYNHAGGAYLARSLFSKTDPNTTSTTVLADLFPVGNWAVLDVDMLDPPDVTTPTTGRDTPVPYSIMDCSSHPMAILYFPARLDKAAATDFSTRILQYVNTDNSVYINADKSNLFYNKATSTYVDIQHFVCIDPASTSGSPPPITMDGQYVITAAGKASGASNRLYYDSSTALMNWRK